jgi:hypothetical protein
MIRVKFHGRLGNQLFQYAFATMAASRLKTSFFIDDNSQNPLIRKYFKLRLFEERINKYFKNCAAKKNLTQREIQEDSFPDAESMLDALENNVGYYGFYQSEKYFCDYLSLIKKRFQLKKKYKKEFERKFNVLFNTNKTIAIHLRRKDYATDFFDSLGGDNISLPLSYYHFFLKKIENIEEYKVIFVSDDIKYARENFPNHSNFYFEQNSEIIDFQLILNADIICTANSSFSWWAAYLNNKKDKVVYCPEYWMGHKIKRLHPKEIIPSQWKVISY